MRKKNCFIFLALIIIVFTFNCEPLLSLASTLNISDTSIADTTLENMTVPGGSLQDTTISENTLQDTTIPETTLGDPTINIDDSLQNDFSAVSNFAHNASLSSNEVTPATATTFTSTVPTADQFSVGDILQEGDKIANPSEHSSVCISYYEFETSEKTLFGDQSPNFVEIRQYTDFYFKAPNYNKPTIPYSQRITGWKIFKVAAEASKIYQISVCPIWKEGYVITVITPDYYENPYEMVCLPNENIIKVISQEIPSKLNSLKCIGWKNSDGNFYDFDNGICPATKVDTFTLQTMVLAPHSSEGPVSAGKCYVERGSAHKLDSSSWKVNNGADGCVYQGGIVFYVPENGIYTFTAR